MFIVLQVRVCKQWKLGGGGLIPPAPLYLPSISVFA